MSRSSNSLRVSDVITTPIKLKYTSSYDCVAASGAGIRVLTGVNGPVTVTGSVPQETLNYRSVRQLYYANYTTGSYLSTTSSFDCSLQSTAASGTLDADLRYFPTGSDATVRILSIPREIFGQKIARYGFLMSSSAYTMVDDGNGNIIDATGLPYVNFDYYNPEFTDWYVYEPATHIGNIIYSQGIVIITNPDYLYVFPYPPVAVNDTAVFASATTPKTVNILANDTPGTGTLVPSSVVLFGGDVALFTNNLNGTVTLNTTTIGTYTTYYTVTNSGSGGLCGLISNVATITVTVI